MQLETFNYIARLLCRLNDLHVRNIKSMDPDGDYDRIRLSMYQFGFGAFLVRHKLYEKACKSDMLDVADPKPWLAFLRKKYPKLLLEIVRRYLNEINTNYPRGRFDYSSYNKYQKTFVPGKWPESASESEEIRTRIAALLISDGYRFELSNGCRFVPMKLSNENDYYKLIEVPTKLLCKSTNEKYVLETGSASSNQSDDAFCVLTHASHWGCYMENLGEYTVNGYYGFGHALLFALPILSISALKLKKPHISEALINMVANALREQKKFATCKDLINYCKNTLHFKNPIRVNDVSKAIKYISENPHEFHLGDFEFIRNKVESGYFILLKRIPPISPIKK